MKKLIFARGRGNEFYLAMQERAIDMVTTKKQSKYANSIILFKVCLYLTLVLPYLLLFKVTTQPAFYTTYLLLALISLLLAFNVAHDAAHHGIFPNKRYNDMFFSSTSNILGNHAHVWRKYHIEWHHVYTNIHGSDIECSIIHRSE
ncbi:MAG: fatty acid desaturase [Chryseolinea sp.]